MSNAQTFRFVQFTDVHLSQMPSFEWKYWNVKRVLGFLNWHRGRRSVHSIEVVGKLLDDMAAQPLVPDHILVTGDLINIGLPEEYRRAQNWLKSIGSGTDVTVIPGNHDIYVAMNTMDSIGHWRNYMTSFGGLENLSVTGSAKHDDSVTDIVFPFVRRCGPVAFVGCNSAEPTPPFIAAGQLGDSQRAALLQILKSLGEKGLVRVVLIHHPPLPGLAPARRGLKDAEALQEVLKEAGAELVLFGHNHRSQVIEMPGPNSGANIPIVGLGSSSAARVHHGEELARYNLFEVTRQANQVTIAMQARGLATENGPVVELEQRTFQLPLTQEMKNQ